MKRFALPFLLSAASLCSCGGSSSHTHVYDDIKVTKDAYWRTYLSDAFFDPSGLEVALHCKDCDEWVVAKDFRVKGGESLKAGQESVTLVASGLEIPYQIRVRESFRIACIGDSLTRGHAWPNESYPSYLSSIVNEHFEVGNFGENGISITGYGGRWDDPAMKYQNQQLYEDSIAYDPDILVVMLGSNDANQWGKASSLFEEEYRKLLSSYKQALPYARTLLLVSPPTAKGNAFDIPDETLRDYVNPLQRKIASDYGFDTLDLREEFEDIADYEAKFLRPGDGVHLTIEGAKFVARRVWESIQEMTSGFLLEE